MMNDETEPFERRLSRQLTREIPTHWRAEILSAAHAAGPRPSTLNPRPSLLSTLISQLSTLFRPHPQAWAGLATVWVAIVVLNFSARDNSTVATRQILPPSPEVIAAWRQQRRELASLTEPNQSREIEAPRPRLPQPRSNRRAETFAA